MANTKHENVENVEQAENPVAHVYNPADLYQMVNGYVAIAPWRQFQINGQDVQPAYNIALNRAVMRFAISSAQSTVEKLEGENKSHAEIQAALREFHATLPIDTRGEMQTIDSKMREIGREMLTAALAKAGKVVSEAQFDATFEVYFAQRQDKILAELDRWATTKHAVPKKARKAKDETATPAVALDLGELE